MSTIQPKSSRSASRPLRTTRDLNIAQRWLLDVMHENQFGRIENLRVEHGQTKPDQRLNIIRAARFGGREGGGKVPVSDDAELKKSIWDLLDEIERLQNGYIVRLEFRHGLPFLLETTAATALGGLSPTSIDRG
jgi:hypothetical protein